MEFFSQRRLEQLKPWITPELLAEYRADPNGAHGRSKELGQVLNFLRSRPLENKVFAYAEVPFERYRLGMLHAERGVAPDIDMTATYPTEDEALYAVFVRRLEMLGLLSEKG